VAETGAGTDATRQEAVARLLEELRNGNRGALNELLPLVYDELHRLARQQRRNWVDDHTLDSVSLVHEAYLRLVDQSRPKWSSHPHFLAVAATAMRQILLDYAKRKHAKKREGERVRVSLDSVENTFAGPSAEAGSEMIIAVDAALAKLETVSERQSRIVECRFFGGMSIEETAQALDISPATVKRGWAMAQAWLYRELERERS
jgi:RNA polymerase sigma factor (TIGR02999 family)